MPCQIGGIDIHGGSQIYDFRSRKKKCMSNLMFYATGKKSLDFRSAERKWDIDIIPKMTYSFSAVSKD